MGVLTGQIRKDDPRGKNAWPKPPLLAVIIWRPVPPIDAHQSVAILHRLLHSYRLNHIT
jgi:hypothetical protein